MKKEPPYVEYRHGSESRICSLDSTYSLVQKSINIPHHPISPAGNTHLSCLLHTGIIISHNTTYKQTRSLQVDDGPYPWLSFSNTHRALLSFTSPRSMAPLRSVHALRTRGVPQYHLSTARQWFRKKGKIKDVNQHREKTKPRWSKDPCRALVEMSKNQQPPLAT